MAEDCVILLSSDESDAFVTPHKEPPQPVTQQYGFSDDDDDNDGFPRPRVQMRVSSPTVATEQRTVAALQTDSSSARNGSAVAQRGSAVLPTRTNDVIVIGDAPIQLSSSPASRQPVQSRSVASSSKATETETAASNSHPPVVSPSVPFAVCIDDDDDDDDDTWMQDSRPLKRQKTTSHSAVKACTTTSRSTQAAKEDANCIDLLSSSDAEAEHIPSANGLDEADDGGFVDIDDLLANPPPPTRAPPLPQAQPTGRKPSPAGRKPSAEIMLLSSSPPAPLTKTASSATARDASAQAAPRPQASKSLKRSFSEGHMLGFDDDDDDDDLSIWGSASQGVEDLLAAWRERPGTETAPARARPSSRHGMPASRRRSSLDSTQRRPGSTKATNASSNQAAATSGADKEARRREKEAAREQARREKEADKERRQREKEVEKERRKITAEMAREKKAQERADAVALNNANRSRADKAVAAPEMIVRLPTALPQATKEAAEGLINEIKASSEMWRSPLLDNVVTWRRKVTADYHVDAGHWVPVPPRIEDEKHAMAVFRADDLVKLILAAHDPDIKHEMGGYDLASHARAMKQAFARHTIVYLVEGLPTWKSKNRSIRNRQFADAVRNAGGSAAPTPAAAAATAALSRFQQAGQADVSVTTAAAAAASRPSNRLGRRGQQRPPQHLDEAVVDDALLDLQMGFDDDDDDDDFDIDDDDDDDDDDDNDAQGAKRKTKIMVHETQSSLDTARWIKIFTEQIATSRYRRLQDEIRAASASFCMDSGQIATGDGGSETYVLMLQQIARVTEPVALGVAARYATLPKLVRGFRDEGPLALEGCLKSRNRNGGLSDRAVGQALSRRIYKVLMGTDEASTDI